MLTPRTLQEPDHQGHQPNPVVRPGNRRVKTEKLHHQQRAEPIPAIGTVAQRSPRQDGQHGGRRDSAGDERPVAGVVTENSGDAASPGLVEGGSDRTDAGGVTQQICE